MSSELEEELIAFLVNDLAIPISREDVRTDMLMGGDLGVDSVSFAELQAFLEDRYGIVVTDEEFTYDNFITVDAVLRYVRRKREL